MSRESVARAGGRKQPGTYRKKLQDLREFHQFVQLRTHEKKKTEEKTLRQERSPKQSSFNLVEVAQKRPFLMPQRFPPG